MVFLLITYSTPHYKKMQTQIDVNTRNEQAFDMQKDICIMEEQY